MNTVGTVKQMVNLIFDIIHIKKSVKSFVPKNIIISTGLNFEFDSCLFSVSLKFSSYGFF